MNLSFDYIHGLDPRPRIEDCNYFERLVTVRGTLSCAAPETISAALLRGRRVATRRFLAITSKDHAHGQCTAHEPAARYQRTNQS